METSPAMQAVYGWMVTYLAALTGRDSGEIAPTDRLSAFDLDSVDAVEIALHFEQGFGFAINPETFLVGDLPLAEIAGRLAAGPVSSDWPSVP